MTMFRYALVASAALRLVGGAAVAQTATEGSSTMAPAGSMAPAQPMPPAADQGQPQSVAPMPSDSGAAPMTAPDAGSNTSATMDPSAVQHVASPPVPDTPANRAKYGRPMSRAGKHTAAAGN